MQIKIFDTNERPDIVLDLERLKTNCHGNLDVVAELLDHLLQKSAPRWIASLEEGVQSGDSEHLQGVCHAMKGAAATVFSWRISNLALEFEQLAHKGEVEILKQRIPDLQQAFAELAQWKTDNL
ncbi:MAG: Hpt domain-containing protein [Proteobacteria bacterium]|nr:Hpt domain-containing protein [Pseudomonadota bacterium]MBU1139736.1 Hpt domain-containing protein [Pseudomonadota bacterium]MBU1418825.1 Hpt domain-containing protein [Pseudomonadota bacterium]MBU1453533.1 Hpt domain-containing protein [Pseudomonadota bacterium]